MSTKGIYKWFVLLIGVLLVGCSAVTTPQAASLPTSTSSPASTTTPSQPAATAAVTSTTAADPAVATATPAAGAQASASLPAGEIQFNLVAANSSVDYRVREQLARLNFPTDAVGKTNAVSGSVVFKQDGTIDQAASKITVDVSTLKSDSSMRDGYVARAILQSSQYQYVTFVPTSVTGLPWPLPQSGNVSFKVTGNLTIRNVTKPVTWDVKGSIQNGIATGTATTSFKFEDFNLNQPRVPVVLNVVDNITLEATLSFQPASK